MESPIERSSPSTDTMLLEGACPIHDTATGKLMPVLFQLSINAGSVTYTFRPMHDPSALPRIVGTESAEVIAYMDRVISEIQELSIA